MNKCKICGSTNCKTYIAKEMMLGYMDEFEYYQCEDCGCLQISEIPEDLPKYYPTNYYSFNESDSKGSFIKKFLILKRDKYALLHKGFLGKKLCDKFPPNSIFDLISKTNINKYSKILDVGCGDGDLLNELNEFGFNHLLGIDPFIEEDKLINGTLHIKKASITDLNEKFDLIMFNHSLEHMPNQLETLKKVKSLLNENGTCLIRIPTVSSYVWEKYGVNWVELDAPRHFYLHSLKSLDVLAKQASLNIKDIEFDATEFELLGSEQYSHGITQQSERSYSVSMDKSIFTPDKIDEFKNLAKKLNIEHKGGRIAAYLK